MRWIFLRGLVRERAHWGKFLALFGQNFPRDKVDCLDILGNGDLFQQRSPLSVTAIVDDLRERAHIKTQEKTGIFSISLGGMLSTDWLKRYPLDFSAGVILNTSLRGYNFLWERLQWTACLEVLRILGCSDREQRERLMLKLSSNLHSQDPEVQKLWIDIARKRPVTKSNALRQLAAAALYSPPATRPNPCPLLLLGAEKDRLVSSRCTQTIADRWGTDMQLHPTAGHDLPLDAGDWVIDQVKIWRKKYSL